MIWATFEHIGNTPLADYTYKPITQPDKLVKQNTMSVCAITPRADRPGLSTACI